MRMIILTQVKILHKVISQSALFYNTSVSHFFYNIYWNEYKI
jgi:hypothetical protein